MQQCVAIDVVCLGESEKVRAFFSYGILRFDRFFSQLLMWESDQDLSVVNKDGQEKGTILFRHIGCGAPTTRFVYKGTVCESLEAHQFEEGDTITFNVSKIFNNGLTERIVMSYKLSQASLLADSTNSPTIAEFGRCLQEVELRDKKRLPVSPLIFNAAKEWR